MLLEFDCVEEPKETKEEDVFPSGEDSEIYRKTIEKMLLNMYLPSEKGMYDRVAKLVRRKGGKHDAK